MSDPIEKSAPLEQQFLAGIFQAANLRYDQEVVDALANRDDLRVFSVHRHKEVWIAFQAAYIGEAGQGGVSGVADPGRIWHNMRDGVFADYEALTFFLTECTPAADLKFTLTSLREEHVRREIAQIGQNLVATAHSGIPVSDLLSRVASNLMALRDTQTGRGESQVVTYADSLDFTQQKIHDDTARFRAGLAQLVAASGIQSVDDLLNGGLYPGTLNVLAARPAVGKSSLCTNWLFHSIVAMNDPAAWGVLVIMEMSAYEINLRDISSEAPGDIYTNKMKSGKVTDEELEQVDATIANLKKLRNVLVHERVTTVDSCLSNIHADIMRMGSKPTLVAIDYLQLLNMESGGKGFSMNMSAAVGEITRKLKQFALEHQIPILLLSQLNRDLEKRQGDGRRPMLSDLRESGNIEQDADLVAFLYPKNANDDWQAPTREVGFYCAKNRNGGQGDVDLTFHKSKTKFTTLTGTRETAPAQTQPAMVNGLAHTWGDQ